MADLFDTSVSPLSGVPLAGGLPAIRQPGTEAAVTTDTLPFQEAAFNLQTRKQAKIPQEDFLTEDKIKTPPAYIAAGESLVSKMADIRGSKLNRVEQNKLKQEAILAAMLQGGKDGRVYIEALAERADVHEERRGDTTVLVNSLGDVVEVADDNPQEVRQRMMERRINRTEEVLPNTMQALGGLTALSTQAGFSQSEKDVNDMVISVSNVSGRLKRIANDYHMTASSLNQEEFTKLKVTTMNGYKKGASELFRTLLAPEYLKAVRSGRMKRSDVALISQQMKADLIDEVTSQRTDVNISELSSHIQMTIDNIETAYEDVERNDLVSVQQRAKTWLVQDEFLRERQKQELGITLFEDFQPVVRFATEGVAAVTLLKDRSTDQQLTAAERETAKQGLAGFGQMTESMARQVDTLGQYVFQETFNFDEFKTDVLNIKTRDELAQSLSQLSSITNHENGWVHSGSVSPLIDLALPTYFKLVEQGLMTEDEYNSLARQLHGYQNYTESVISQMGLTFNQFDERFKTFRKQ